MFRNVSLSLLFASFLISYGEANAASFDVQTACEDYAKSLPVNLEDRFSKRSVVTYKKGSAKASKYPWWKSLVGKLGNWQVSGSSKSSISGSYNCRFQIDIDGQAHSTRIGLFLVNNLELAEKIKISRLQSEIPSLTNSKGKTVYVIFKFLEKIRPA